jgi:hypothetical protein
MTARRAALVQGAPIFASSLVNQNLTSTRGTNSTMTPHQSARVRQRDHRVSGSIAVRFESVYPRSLLKSPKVTPLVGFK